MEKYILITMKAEHKVTHEERKNYLHSFYGSYVQKKKGMIQKFNNAYNFKAVSDDYCSQYPIVSPAKIENPDNYITPEQLLYKHLWIDLRENYIVKFVVPFGFEEHNIDEYSYHHEDICKKFVNFLKKVYPNIEIEMSYIEGFNYSVKDFVLNYFYQCMDFKGIHYTVECSSHRLLTEEEIDEIYEILNDCVDYNWEISQYYCEVCKNYHSDSPYHIEVNYKK